jgi:acylphosphatase
MANQRLDVRFTGHVQGVGFRYTTLGIAGRRPVTGYVQNLGDGSVRLVAEGAPAELEGLLGDIQRAFEGHLRETLVDRLPASGEFPGFSIRY